MPDIHALAAKFDSWCTTPERAYMQCVNESARWAMLLKSEGIEATLIAGWAKGFGIGHVAVLINGIVWDWTARQFWPDAPHPRIVPLSVHLEDFPTDKTVDEEEIWSWTMWEDRNEVGECI